MRDMRCGDGHLWTFIKSAQPDGRRQRSGAPGQRSRKAIEVGILSHPHVHASRQEALPGQAVAGRRFRKTKFGIGCGWTVVPWWYGISSRLVIDASSSSNSQSCRQGKGGVCIGWRAILARPLPARPDGSWHGIQSARLSARGWASRNLHQLHHHRQQLEVRNLVAGAHPGARREGRAQQRVVDDFRRRPLPTRWGTGGS